MQITGDVTRALLCLPPSNHLLASSGGTFSDSCRASGLYASGRRSRLRAQYSNDDDRPSFSRSAKHTQIARRYLEAGSRAALLCSFAYHPTGSCVFAGGWCMWLASVIVRNKPVYRALAWAFLPSIAGGRYLRLGGYPPVHAARVSLCAVRSSHGASNSALRLGGYVLVCAHRSLGTALAASPEENLPSDQGCGTRNWRHRLYSIRERLHWYRQ